MRSLPQRLQNGEWDAWRVAAILWTILVIVSLLVSVISPGESPDPEAGQLTATVPSTDPTALAITNAQLENEKLRREIEQLDVETRDGLSGWLWANSVAAVSAMAALGIAGFGVYKWFGDRATEREKRDEERFQQVVNGLGSDSESTRIQAAVALRTFSEPGYERFYIQVFNLAVVNLRQFGGASAGPNPTPLEQALTFVFRTAYPKAYELVEAHPELDPDSELLDATGIILVNAHLNNASLQHLNMPRANLHGVELYGAELNGINIDDADLRYADLRSASLKPHVQNGDSSHTQGERADFRCADLRVAEFHDAFLESANFQDANLSRAHLQGANLTSAHFDRALLCDVRFSGAILNNAQFKGAYLDKTDIENAASMRNAQLIDVHCLTEDQLWACVQKGAIVACSVSHDE